MRDAAGAVWSLAALGGQLPEHHHSFLAAAQVFRPFKEQSEHVQEHVQDHYAKAFL